MTQTQNQDQENIQLLPAKNQDVMMLTAFSKWAFETDVQVGAPALAGPPGYKSNQFYSQMNRAKYLYSFFADGIIIGGAVLIPGGNPKGTEVEIARIFLNRFTRNSAILNIRETKNLSFTKKTKLRKN